MTPYYQQSGITIYHADCRDVLDEWEGLRTQTFSLLLTDPPYGIDYGNAGGFSASHGWSTDREGLTWDAEPVDPQTMARCMGVCEKAVIWGGNYYVLPPSMGWLVWDKGQREFSLADGELAWTSENRALRIFNYPRGRALKDRNGHPTQKPEPLIAWVLAMFPDSSTVFDPFMGSGTTLVASKRLGRQAVGIEREEKYCEIAAKRLSQVVLPLEMGA